MILAIKRQIKINMAGAICLERGAVVEWLEQLGYGAESRRIA